MKTRVLLFAAIAATTFTFVACGNKQAKTNETAAVEQSGAMEIDSLLANAETLADQAVTRRCMYARLQAWCHKNIPNG